MYHSSDPRKQSYRGIDRAQGVTGDITMTDFSDSVSQVITLNGHKIGCSNSFTSFECKHCDESFEVPEIFQASTSFRTVVYQLYLLGHFKSHRCPEATSIKADNLQMLVNDYRKDNYSTNPPDNLIGDVHWMLPDSVYQWEAPDGGRVVTNDNVVLESDSPQYAAGDRLTNTAMTKLREGHRLTESFK